jgi:hypothetical protein
MFRPFRILSLDGRGIMWRSRHRPKNAPGDGRGAGDRTHPDRSGVSPGRTPSGPEGPHQRPLLAHAQPPGLRLRFHQSLTVPDTPGLGVLILGLRIGLRRRPRSAPVRLFRAVPW